jgi:polyisoprenoid-binding protein YceI
MKTESPVSRAIVPMLVTCLALAAMVMAGEAGAGEGTPPVLVLIKGGTLRIEGTSTLHPWHADAKEIDATFGLKGTAPVAPFDLETLARTSQLAVFNLTVPVKSLSSGEGGLDDNLRKAMKADQFPDIVFQMDSLEISTIGASGVAAAGAPFSAKLHGKLTVSGVQRPVDVDIDAKPEAGAWRVTGHKTLSMSDYQVKPPVLMMGMLHTGDPIDIKFDLELKPGASS